MINLIRAMKLCLVIGPGDCYPRDFFTVIQEAVAGGVTSIQLRDKQADEKQIAFLGKRLLDTFPAVPLIINDHVEVAKFLNTGLHIGQSDMEYSIARKIMGQESWIGLSIENREQAKKYQSCDASYFGIGPVFSTNSKLDAASPLGIDGLNAVLSLLAPKPCVAIGGITLSNAALLARTNIQGVAVISAISAAKNPCYAAEQLLTHFGAHS